MSLETVALISILTLLSFCLGSNVFLLSVLNPALSQVSNQSRLEAIGVLQEQIFKIFPIVFLLVFACAIVLNVISHSRSEPYLLKIGLISLAIYFLLAFISFRLTEAQTINLLTQPDLEQSFNLWQSNILLWLQLPTVLVSY